MNSQTVLFRKDLSASKAAALALWLAGILTGASLSALAADSALSCDLRIVDGMDHFQGGVEAKKLLAKNRFVVADPYFKQLFQPYIENPLPVFITADSAWDTYHVLLEEGVKQLEEIQGRRLEEFSRLLLQAANAKAADGGPDFAELAAYASFGLAFQDAKHAESLDPAERRVFESLRSGAGMAPARIGFPLLAANFSPASFYTESPSLAGYFSARQWYASVDFRLEDARETRLALNLAWLVHGNLELSNLWVRLSKPFDLLLAPADDGDLRAYNAAAAKVAGAAWTPPLVANRIAEIQQELAVCLPEPAVNDQLLSPGDYMHFGKRIKGFRLLPSRRLPCAVTFQHTTDPAIPGRMMPSGLDFFVSSPTLRSRAAVRVLEIQSGKQVAAAVQNYNCEPFPSTTHGEAMRLLALLQQPVPATAPPAFRTDAWADGQLWTQLGAWAEQRHTWALHANLGMEYLGGPESPTGMAAPYPEFFLGLAALSRRTANALEQAGLADSLSAKEAAAGMLDQINASKRWRLAYETTHNEQEAISEAATTRQFDSFFAAYCAQQLKAKGLKQSKNQWNQTLADLELIARRVSDGGQASESEMQIFKQFASARDPIPQMLRDFAPVCERLAELARKSLAGQALDQTDSDWIKNYGVTLAKLHFYDGNSWLEPLDDFPILTRIFANPAIDSVLYAGLARPQSLYVIVSDGLKLRLYQGAVMTYREFARNTADPLNDETWRKSVCEGMVPAAPAFTRSFYAEAGARELINILRGDPMLTEEGGEVHQLAPKTRMAAEALYSRAQPSDLRDLLKLLPELRGNGGDVAISLIKTVVRLATPNDMPKLIALLSQIQCRSTTVMDSVMPELAQAIAHGAWEPHQEELVRLLSSPKLDIGAAAAYVLASRPEAIDVHSLSDGFAKQGTNGRSFYCRLFGVAASKAEARQALLRALDDADADVRWQALSAICAAKWNDQTAVSALVKHLGDTNRFVGAGAAYVLGEFGSTNAAPALLESLEAATTAPPLSKEEWQRQVAALGQFQMLEQLNAFHARDPIPMFWPDHAVKMRPDPLRILPGQFHFPPPLGLYLDESWIRALGQLHYEPATAVLLSKLGGDNHDLTVEALRKIAPERLEPALLELALNQHANMNARGLALFSLSASASKVDAAKLIPLLDETAVLVPQRYNLAKDWRLCDQAAVAMAKLLGWEVSKTLATAPAERDELIRKLRQATAPQP
jgi:hypothetical protein